MTLRLEPTPGGGLGRPVGFGYDRFGRSAMSLSPTLAEFEEARATLIGRVHRTPLLSSLALGRRADCTVWLKAENLQKTGSFKPRGAFNKVRHLPDLERNRGVITASAGNHGQALAYVASREGIPGFVVMPERANPSKVAAVREYGAHAILHGKVWDDAYARSLELAEEKGLSYVHPFKDRFIMSGQGTAALEILEDLPDVEVIIVPIGGGGLIAGMAAAVRHKQPGVRVVGVEPTGSANFAESRGQGAPVELDSVETIADGLSTRKTDPDVFALVERLVDELVTVTDDELLAAIRFLLERAKLLAEPAGAATTAALLSGKLKVADRRVVAVVSGGNFDVAGRLDLGYPQGTGKPGAPTTL
jgi:threonine dehydratase